MEQETKEITTKQSNNKNGDGDDNVGSSNRNSSSSSSSDNNNVSKNNPAKPQQSTIIQSANGVKIESKLNPAAKEFYPAHLLLQRCAQANKFSSAFQARTATEQQQQQNANTNIGENKRQLVEIECDKMKQQDNIEAKKEHGEQKVESKENAILANNITEVIENEIRKSELERDDFISSNVKLETETKTQIAAVESQKMLPPVECVGDMGDTVNNNNSDNSEQEQHLHKQEQEQNPSNFITYKQHDATCDDSKAEKLQESTAHANEQLIGLTDADEKREKKLMQSRKITKLSMSGLSGGKHSSVGGDKAMTRLSSVMGRTKRISESLHNLSSTFKSKMESRKSESSARALARSSTTIPKTTVRMRKPTGSKTYLSDCNGLRRDGAKLSTSKDAISLRSTSSTERNISSKTSLHLSGGGHSVQRNSSTTSTKTIDKPSTTLEASGAKTKKSTPYKLPRETVASALRQSEAQKRRNLFPNDDPDSNIELSQFLFK